MTAKVIAQEETKIAEVVVAATKVGEEPQKKTKKKEILVVSGEKNEGEKGEKFEGKENEKEVEVEKDCGDETSLWGVQLLLSKGAKAIDVVLLKFLRAREFKINDAFEMLKKTFKWRKESRIYSVLD
ncbi:hypothetical protein RJT34_16405 [Clitoria ternatea]|uniref:CRAL/TRIO N-terminal domain-containing protein n=1 Tax=Clitoria ternatea TaxID=43366 RepID=A0AAN9PDM9_CLITE